MANAAYDRTFDELLAALYRGPLEDPPWRSFLPRFCQMMGAFAVSLVLRPPAEGDEGLILNVQRPGSDPALAPEPDLADPSDWPSSAYKEQFFTLDPFINLPPGEVISLAQLIPEEELLNSEYYRQYLEPAGVFHILGADTIEPDGLQARLRACRGRHEAEFGEHERLLFERVIPHLRQAIQLHARLNRIASERNLYAGAVERLAVASVILDERGTVIDTNALARELLEERDGLGLNQGRLHFGQRIQAETFQQLLERVLHPRDERPGMAEAMRLPRPSGRPDLGLVIRPVPASEWSERQSGPRVAVFISDPERQGEAPREVIRRLFDFTNAEANLALLLARGLPLADAAQSLGISQHTARAQLKSIFAKAGVTRQAELVRLLLKSVASLG